MSKLVVLPLLPALLSLALSGEIAAALDTAVPPAPSAATEAFLAPSSALPVDENSPPEVKRIEELRTYLATQRNEAVAMDRLAETAIGEDLRALRTKSLELRFASLDPIEELVAAVFALEEKGVDVTTYRRQLEQLLPEFTPSIHSTFDIIVASKSALETKLESASGDSRLELMARIKRHEILVGRILSLGTKHVDMLEQLELPTDTARAWLTEKLAARARLLSARLHLASIQLSDAEELSAAAPDNAELLAQVLASTNRVDASIKSLSATVDLMNHLEMDTVAYKQLLIESTGEITADVFESGVASQLIVGWMDSGLEAIEQSGPRVAFRTLVFLLVLGIFWLLARFARRVTAKAVEAPRLRFSELLKRMIVSAAWAAVMTLGLLLALSQLGFQVGPMLAGLGIAGFVLGFALQDTLSNFASGIMILTYRPYDVGDLIDCSGGVFGRVSQMNLVSTTILTMDNQTRVVPNGKIWGDVITNVTAQKVRRVDLVFGISYTDDIAQAEEVIWSVIKEHPKVLDDPEPMVKVHELGESSVNLIARPWVSRDDYWDVHWDMTREVKLRFDREGVTIPFPQRDVHFHATNGAAPPHESGGADSAQVGSTKPTAQDPPETDT